MKNLRLVLIVTFQIFLLHCFSSGNGESLSLRFSLQGTDICPTAFLLTEFRAMSKVKCLGLCLNQQTCSGACYNKHQSLCRTFSSTISEATAGAVVDPGFQMYWLEYLDGFYRYGLKAYKRESQKVTHATAQLRCQEMNATLALPMNSNELKYLGNGYWIDMNDKQEEGNWVSGRTGEPPSFIDWGSGEPSGGSSDNCGVIFSYKMHDTPCSRTHSYVCEKLVTGGY